MTEGLRKWINATFLIYIVGVELDLLLLGHFESFWQLLPVVTLPAVLIMTLAWWHQKTLWMRKTIRVLSVVLCTMAVVGIYFHLRSNFEFEREMRPSISGAALLRESLTGALPALAPASLIPMGLLYYVVSEINIEK